MSEGQKKTYQQAAKTRRGGKRLASREVLQTAEAGHLGDTGRIPTGRGNRIPQTHEPAEQPVQERRTAAAVQDRTEARPAAPIWQEEPTAEQPRKHASLLERFRTWQEDDGGSVSPFITLYHTVAENWKRARRRWRHIVREKKAKRFPESEQKAVQLLLFAWSLVPMLGRRLREAMLGRRKRNGRLMAQARAWLGRYKIHPVAFLGAGCAVAAVAVFCSFYTIGTTVTYNGEVVGAVNSRASAEAAREDLEQITTQTLGETYTIEDSSIQYSSGLMRRQEVSDEETFEEQLSDEIGLVTSAYCLYINGERIGATPYAGALEELLEQLKAASTDENTISCEFAEDVEIKQEYVPTSEVMNLGYLAEMLYSTKTAEVTYTVAAGDTWSEIAEDHGLTSKELLALNPGYNIDKLQIGEVLTLSASVPYLTMTVVQREHYVDQVNYDIEYTDTAYLYKGDYKVTSPGEYGAADVVANVTYVNGEETARTVLSYVTLKEPVTEQRLQGTKERPTWLPTGTFRWPTTGRITSRFGYRSSPGGIGSTNHKGIDIAGSYGSPIYAADGGTVTYAGWMSGYGYLVQISHGNGYVTYYGHNSSLLVSVGDHVYKGQQIARMGSPGNSTGNHCHFEVRYNGVPKNPLNSLP